MAEPVLARVIIEMLGAPKEHIEQTMRDYVAKLEKDGFRIQKKEISEAQKQEKMFSTFAELEIKFDDLPHLIGFCFDAMPSTVEILSPDTLPLNAREVGDFLNDLQARLHDVDMIVKTLRAQKETLDNNTLAILQNFVIHLLKQGPKDISALITPLGINENDLKPFLQKMIDSGRIKKEGETYKLV